MKISIFFEVQAGLKALAGILSWYENAEGALSNCLWQGWLDFSGYPVHSGIEIETEKRLLVTQIIIFGRDKGLFRLSFWLYVALDINNTQKMDFDAF